MDASLARPLPTPAIAQSSLPPGWEVAHDEVTGLPYYFNFEKNVSSWLPPQAGGSAPTAVGRPQAATTSASRRDAAVRGAQERKKEREAQQADWKAREDALKKIRAKSRARVDDGDDAAAVSTTREDAPSAPSASSPSHRVAFDVRPASTSAAPHPAVPISERRSWLASQPKNSAVNRGTASVADYIACLSKEMDRPVEPVGSFVFDEAAALANLQYRAQKEALAAASASVGAGDWRAMAASSAPQNLSEEELQIWYAFVAADTDGSGSVSKKELYRAFDRIGLRGTAKERAQLYEYADRDKSGKIEWPEFLKLGRKFCRLKTLPGKGAPGRLSKADVVRQRQQRSATAIQAAHRGRMARGRMGATRAAEAEASARRNRAAEDVRRRALAVYSGAGGQGAAVGLAAPAGLASRASRPLGVLPNSSHPARAAHPMSGGYPASEGYPGAYRTGASIDGAVGGSSSLQPTGALMRPDAAARRSSAATRIQTSVRGAAARRQVKQRAAVTEREAKYREAGAEGAASRQILALAASLIRNGADAGGGAGAACGGRAAGGRSTVIAPNPGKPKAPPAKAAPTAVGGAMAKAGVGSKKKKPKAAAGTKGGPPPAEQALANKVAFHRALLATAFAAECKPGTERVPMRALGRILRRAQVPGAETIPAAGEELGHVELTFDEVAVAASKLRARHATGGGLLAPDGGAGVVARAPEAGQLTVESRVALARAFAAADDEARGSVPTSRLPQAFASAGVFASPHALRLLLGAELSVRKRVEWRDFMQIATTLVALQREGFQMLEQRGSDGGGELLLTVHELHLTQPPPHASAYVQALVQPAAGEELLEPACSEPLALSAARTAVGLQLVVPLRRAIGLSLIGQPSRKARSISDPAPVEMLRAQLTAEQLAREYEAVVRADAPTQLVLPLSDGVTERGALILSFAHAATDPSAALAAATAPMATAGRAGGYGAYCASATPHAGVPAWGPPAHGVRALPTATTTSPQVAPPPGLSRFEARLWRSFAAADTDGSGRLSKRELSRAFSVVGVRGTRGDELAVFKQMDKDGSGTVEWEEFRRVGLKLKQLADVAAYADNAPGEAGYRLLASAGGKGVRPADEDLARAVTSIQAAGRGRISRAKAREMKQGQQVAEWYSAPTCRSAFGARQPAAYAQCAERPACAPTYKLVPPSACATLIR